LEFDGVRGCFFWTHINRLRKLLELELEAQCVVQSDGGIGNHNFFMFLVLISNLKTTYFNMFNFE
jgi:hypothetical protein